jgi:AcrR family transcriptional regulator
VLGSDLNAADELLTKAGALHTPTQALSREQILELQRERVLQAMVTVVAELGFSGASVARVVGCAGVSRKTFYEMFDSLEDCFLAVIHWVMSRSISLIFEAFEQEQSWLDGVQTALASLLAFLDAEPEVARVCVVETLAAGPRALEYRQRELAVLAPLIEAGREQAPAGHLPATLAVEGVIASVIGVLHARIVSGEAPPFIHLLGPLTGLVVLPYLDLGSVTTQIERAEQRAREISLARTSQPLSQAAEDEPIPEALQYPVAYRARLCVVYLSEHPGASNSQIAAGIGVAHQGQISTLLGRMAGLDLLIKHPRGAGRRNSWWLTPRGEKVSAKLSEFR